MKLTSGGVGYLEFSTRLALHNNAGYARNVTPSLVPPPLYGDDARRGDFPD